ncbi:MAG: carbohydrate ABC transporter permease [Bacilli bacterium]
MESKHQWRGWIFLAPTLILMAIFTFFPFFKTLGMAFLNGYDPLLGVHQKFSVGIQNFVDAFNYPQFLQCLKNTIIVTIVTVPLSTIIALLIAVALNSIKPFQKLLQTIFFVPYITNTIAIGMVFAIMFTMIGTPTKVTTPGVINSIFGVNINWINIGKIGGSRSTYFTKMFVLCVYIIWNALPFKILVLLGALQSVNKQYYDAAKVDCASRFRTFTKITVPMLSPMLAYVLITGFIGSFKEYTASVAIFGQQLNTFEMNTVVGYIYDQIGLAKYGRAAAGALILFAIILVFTVFNNWVSSKKVHY